MNEELRRFLNKIVVIDTDSNWLYVGVLKKVGKDFIALQDVDAHDLTEVAVIREQYLVNIKINGIVINRKEVLVNRERLIGLSLLDDVCI